jgi:5'-3' exonuclease
MLEAGATHLAVATDHVIESFRNDLWPDYKDGSDLEPKILSQFGILEDALQSMGVVVWAMVEHEADDGLGAGAAMAAADRRVEQVLICTPDKDLAQCVVGARVIQFDRRKRQLVDEEAVIAKFGVAPNSIPDYLALVGDTSDGFPGVKGWGAKSTATVLARYQHLEAIPRTAADWDVSVRGAPKLAASLVEEWENALLFRHLATVDRGAPVSPRVDDLAWPGPTKDFGAICERLGAPAFVRRAEHLAFRRASPAG